MSATLPRTISGATNAGRETEPGPVFLFDHSTRRQAWQLELETLLDMWPPGGPARRPQPVDAQRACIGLDVQIVIEPGQPAHLRQRQWHTGSRDRTPRGRRLV